MAGIKFIPFQLEKLIFRTRRGALSGISVGLVGTALNVFYEIKLLMQMFQFNCFCKRIAL